MSISTVNRETVTADWLLSRFSGRTAAKMESAIAELITGGEILPGAQLPTIRDFAKAAQTSVGTVLIAWNGLRDAGLIETHRRGGTTVAEKSAPTPATDQTFIGWSAIDLAQSAPDISLQPELGGALLSTLDSKNLNVFGREYMTERLVDAVRPNWPFAAQAWTTAGGGTEALLLATAAAAPPGSVVAVDEPLSPGFLDTLQELHLTAVGVAADEHGPTVESLRHALDANPAAFIFQPGAPFAVHHSVTAARARELAELIASHDGRVWVVEDDSIGPLASREAPSLGEFLPDAVVRIRSYCKAYGIDVRTSVIGGARELVEGAIALRSHGVGSNSRILQDALAYLIGSDDAAESVAEARSRYEGRKKALMDALAAEGLAAKAGPESLVVWVGVNDETEALIGLARRGISVGAGSKSFVSAPESALLRISVTQLPDDAGLVQQLAHAIAESSSKTFREYFD